MVRTSSSVDGRRSSKRAAFRCFQILHAVRAMRELRPFRKLAGEAVREADHQGKKLAPAFGRSTRRRHQDRISCQVSSRKRIGRVDGPWSHAPDSTACTGCRVADHGALSVSPSSSGRGRLAIGRTWRSSVLNTSIWAASRARWRSQGRGPCRQS